MTTTSATPPDPAPPVGAPDGDRRRGARSRLQWVGLVLGPVLALVAASWIPESYLAADGVTVPVSAAGRATVGVLVWMAVWWLSEAIEVYATALLPIVLFPLLGIADVGTAAAPYGSDLVFLFLGGFLMALAMQRWRLDERIALATLLRVGTEPRRMVGGFMLATAAMSAFVSNTATAAAMLPIAASVLALVLPADGEAAHTAEGRSFGLCLLLGIAYAASIGGMATIIGSPPNGILVQFLRDQVAAEYRRDLGFLDWMAVGVPLAAVFLLVAWWLLVRVVYPVRLEVIAGGRELLRERHRSLGPPRASERVVLGVFLLAVLGWTAGPFLPLPGLSDAGVAMTAGLLLFVLPVDRHGTPALDWATARRLPWGVLVLFGGGLSLAAAVRVHGIAELVGSKVGALGGAPQWLVVLAVVTLVVFLTELTSNTATTATLLPILAGVAIGIGADPLLLALPTALAASCAFMMPVATPPNAIVFATGHVTIPQMCRAGLWLNFAGIVLVMAAAYGLAVPLFLR